ncbi:UDP-N-acetylmuramate--L-alanine ligase [Cellulosimicrobium arenosum]|uniref:UDP-N-acetylmuramate--L-alanine ligase n=1 Tax=Cellulosimicrobium arenosum TaxID=2708133 RepID=A0A927J037_9MICO|nr:UDP-N-acetylmuramate--L-alanine ligase [Cellulosimicrobium arenosum]MBD8079192.1 UDP-N-acetylmuramate--L-alanine ligase [Cellulosimicrobium arenosum]
MTPERTGEVPGLAELGVVHLVGVGGAGMSVVARLLVAHGVVVQGSDATGSTTLDELAASGVRTWVGHDAAHVAGADTVVVSSAVRETNPELAAARSAGLRVLHRSQALAALMAAGRSVAVAGAHGKTTTSAMVATVLRSAGVDPSFAIGGTVVTEDGVVPGGHLGAGDVLVAEADESDGSFLAYAPDVAVVTNIEPDHLDHYGTRAAFEQAFVDFAERVVPGGALVACADDPGSRELAAARRAAGAHVVTYGTADDADLVLRDVDPAPVDALGGVRATLVGRVDGLDVGPLELRLRVPGHHNALNATAAVVTAVLLGVAPERAVAGAATFCGTGRRFEARGEAGGVRVIDDYAHHPTEIRALLAAARTVVGAGRLVVLFQPHLYSRTRTFATEFADALGAAETVVVTGVYAAREDPEPGVGARTIVDLMAPGAGIAVEDRVQAAHRVADAARPGDVVLTVGAGDVTELGPLVLERLAARTERDD